MPDRETGWHDAAFLNLDGRSYRWHHCEACAVDTLVLDTPAARKAHAKECGAAAAQAKREAERSRAAEASERLRRINQLRKETHAR